MVARVEFREQSIGAGRIASDLVEVDHLIEVTGSSNPLIDSLAICFFGLVRMVEGGTDEGQDGASCHLDCVRMSSRNDLTVGANNVLDNLAMFRCRMFAEPAEHSEIVHAFKDEEVARSRLG